jgi:hypothetical protein
MVEHTAHNGTDVGSTPTEPIIYSKKEKLFSIITNKKVIMFLFFHPFFFKK